MTIHSRIFHQQQLQHLLPPQQILGGQQAMHMLAVQHTSTMESNQSFLAPPPPLAGDPFNNSSQPKEKQK